MWRLHLTLDKLEHLSTYACGEVTLGRFVNFGFKNFLVEGLWSKTENILFCRWKRRGKKKGIYIKICDQCTWVVLWTVSQNEIR